MKQIIFPNDEVEETLNSLLLQTKAILGPKLAGLYLYGSLATGDFDPDSSDIDFLSATSDELSSNEILNLKDMHDRLKESGFWATRLEGAYIPVEKLRKYDRNYEQPFLSSDSPFRVTKLGWDWIINRHILITTPIIVYGPETSRFIDPISENEIKDSVKRLLKTEWPKVVESVAMESRHYQGFAILTMCRAIFALRNGEIVSKTRAADWAIKNLDPKWNQLIRNSLTWRKQHLIDRETLAETKEFVSEVIAAHVQS